MLADELRKLDGAAKAVPRYVPESHTQRWYVTPDAAALADWLASRTALIAAALEVCDACEAMIGMNVTRPEVYDETDPKKAAVARALQKYRAEVQRGA